jgi:hypothetical protein
MEQSANLAAAPQESHARAKYAAKPTSRMMHTAMIALIAPGVVRMRSMSPFSSARLRTPDIPKKSPVIADGAVVELIIPQLACPVCGCAELALPIEEGESRSEMAARFFLFLL